MIKSVTFHNPDWSKKHGGRNENDEEKENSTGKDFVILNPKVKENRDPSESRYNVIVCLTPRAVGFFSSREKCLLGVRQYFERHGGELGEELKIINGFTARVDSPGEQWLLDKGFKVTKDNEIIFFPSHPVIKSIT